MRKGSEGFICFEVRAEINGVIAEANCKVSIELGGALDARATGISPTLLKSQWL